jgi:GntR family transcriptional regulator of arabinose operon
MSAQCAPVQALNTIQNGSNMTSKATAGLSEAAVAAIIEERIRNGTYAPGGRMPAERVLAEEFGVSRRFARMACAQLIEQGLLEKSHYRRPFVAFSGRIPAVDRPSEKSRIGSPRAVQTIAAVLPSNPMFPGGLEIVSGIHKVLADTESPYRLTFLDTFHKDRPEVLRREAQAIRSALDSGAAGLIWWCYSGESTVQEIVRLHPDSSVVFIDRHPQGLHADFVGIDDVESSRTAVEYLFDLGHTHIAHLMDPGNYSTILERAQGYRAAHRARGLPVSKEMVVHLDWDERRMEHAFQHLYSLPMPPTALFTSNDFIAHEFIQVAEANGVRVPEDLSVIGHGNIDRYTPRGFLTSMEQPFEMIGRAAARLMLKHLASGPASSHSYQQVILPAPLVTRTSCREISL